MAGALPKWPNWPAFSQDNAEVNDDLAGYKKAIIARYGREALTESWLKVCKTLESVTNEISTVGSAMIPEVQFEDFLALSEGQKQKLKDIGCFVVKNVFAPEQADEWYEALKEYVASNEQNINGMD